MPLQLVIPAQAGIHGGVDPGLRRGDENGEIANFQNGIRGVPEEGSDRNGLRTRLLRSSSNDMLRVELGKVAGDSAGGG